MQQMIAAALAATSAACASAAPDAEPTGVGLVDVAVTDATRADIVDPERPRRWSVRLFYPACGGGAPGRYAAPELAAAMADGGYYEQPRAEIESWSERRLGGVGAVACGGPRPLATVSIGLGVAGVNYSLLAERLAAAGYVVAIVDHPYGAVSRLPDGTLQSGRDDPLAPQTDADPAVLARRVAEWAADISRTVDAALAGELAAGARIDAARVFALGHSMGGAAAMDACRADPRLAACVNMDGAPFGTKTMDEGGHGQLMILHANPRYSDADLAARGRTRAQWDAMGEQFEAVWTDAFAQGDPEYVRVSVGGTGHMSFSDAPYVMPDTITRFGGDLVDADRAHTLIVRALDAYMRDRAGEAGAFAAALTDAPELELSAPAR